MDRGRPAAAQAFDVEVVEDRTQVRVRVVGEIDLVTAPVLDRHLAGAVGRERPKVVVDLTSVTFLDGRGINSLLAADAAAGAAGTALVLRGVGDHVRRVLAACDLEGRFAEEP